MTDKPRQRPENPMHSVPPWSFARGVENGSAAPWIVLDDAGRIVLHAEPGEHAYANAKLASRAHDYVRAIEEALELLADCDVDAGGDPPTAKQYADRIAKIRKVLDDD
jgi:hypothetical protein